MSTILQIVFLSAAALLFLSLSYIEPFSVYGVNLAIDLCLSGNSIDCSDSDEDAFTHSLHVVTGKREEQIGYNGDLENDTPFILPFP
jgi:hypothetical protein